MKWIKYNILQRVDDDGTAVLVKKEVGYNAANEAVAKEEAYNGEYTVEDDGQPEPTPETSVYDELAAAYSEGVQSA